MYSVLIVDDEERIRRGMETILDWKAMGFTRVQTAENGRAGLEAAKAAPPDLVIADLKMPGIDGIQMIQSLRESGVKCQFIILSGVTDFQYARAAIDLKVATYLLKPVDEEALATKIAELFPPPGEEDAMPDAAVERVIGDITDYIAKNLAQPLKLNAVAADFHYSAPYLGRMFKKVTGESFHDYLERIRMDAAKALLAQNHKVYVAAKMTGYSNVDYFANIFKAYTGETPNEYKKKSEAR